ncbi:MAG: SAM-dependent methyltransferase [Candidatus Hodarchaeota archaeon]
MKKLSRERKIEFGDFQTPNALATQIVTHLRKLGINPATILEPTCGIGSFILAAKKTYPNARVIGFDINPHYLAILADNLKNTTSVNQVEIQYANFFDVDWLNKLQQLEEPILILGNPPWVTSANISILGGTNIPTKHNIHGYQGLDTKTGKSNFDISEWMIIELLRSLNGHNGTLAMLCKESVARKVIMYNTREKLNVASSTIYRIDSKKYFDATVNACLFICRLIPNSQNYICQIYQNLNTDNIIQEIGYIDERMVANISAYQKWKHLQTKTSLKDNKYIWRSGIKHDCVKVMELRKIGNDLVNGFDEPVFIEDKYLFPMLKSSELANNTGIKIQRWMIVPQNSIGEDTSIIQNNAPFTWAYLEKYSNHLDSRASSIYKNRPKYSIFGVGPYTFTPWKIAISGFYKTLKFKLIGPFENKPVVFDDTCYFIGLTSYEEAIILNTILNHPIAIGFFNSVIFWDSKRPITKQKLQQLDFDKFIKEIGYDELLELITQTDQNVNSDLISSELQKMA